MAHKTSADYVLEVHNETKAEFVHSEPKYLVKFLDGYHVNMKTECLIFTSYVAFFLV